jgi:translation initiation factor IF-1
MVCLAKSLVLVGNFGALASAIASRTSHPHINIKSTFDDRRCLDAITHSLLSDNTDVSLESVFTPLLWPILLANRDHMAQLRIKAALLYQQGLQWAARVPVKARVVLVLFLVAAFLMAFHTALTAKDSSLHLKMQHGFHNAQFSVWVDGDLAFSGKVSGSTRKKFGLIPTDSVQGSLSEIIPVRSGRHKVRVRIEPDDAAMQEDGI